jgi:hypothetical protein
MRVHGSIVIVVGGELAGATAAARSNGAVIASAAKQSIGKRRTVAWIASSLRSSQ